MCRKHSLSGLMRICDGRLPIIRTPEPRLDKKKWRKGGMVFVCTLFSTRRGVALPSHPQPHLGVFLKLIIYISFYHLFYIVFYFVLYFIFSSLSKMFFYHTIITRPWSIMAGVIFFKHALTRPDPPRKRGRGVDLRRRSERGRGRRPGSGPPRSKGPPPHPSQPRGGRGLC